MLHSHVLHVAVTLGTRCIQMCYPLQSHVVHVAFPYATRCIPRPCKGYYVSFAIHTYLFQMYTDDGVFKDHVTLFTRGTRCIHLCNLMHSKVLANDDAFKSPCKRYHVPFAMHTYRHSCETKNPRHLHPRGTDIYNDGADFCGEICIIWEVLHYRHFHMNDDGADDADFKGQVTCLQYIVFFGLHHTWMRRGC